MKNKNKPSLKNNFPLSIDIIDRTADSNRYKSLARTLGLDGDIYANPQLLLQETYLLALATSGKHDAVASVQNGEQPRNAIFQQIATMTPLFVHVQTKLHDINSLSNQEKNKYKSIASEYNSLLRDFMSYYPDTKIADLNNFILDAALYAKSADLDMSKATIRINKTINPTIRGAQHEYCVEQQLQYLAVTGQIEAYRPATVHEDIRGIDLIAVTVNGKEVLLDVKASLSEIEAKSRGRSAIYHYNGRVVTVFSLTLDREFQGYICLKQKQIVEKSSPMLDILNAVDLQIAL